MKLPIKNIVSIVAKVLLLAFCILQFALPKAHAASTVQTATLSNFSIPFETGGTPTGSTITYTLVGSGVATVDINIYRLQNISDTPSTSNLVADIQQSNVSTGTYNYFWNALWLLGNDVGRQDGNYKIIVQANDGSTTTAFTVGTLLQITSVDIHSVTAVPSTDAGGNQVLPYVIKYSLAKNSLVTVQIKNTQGTVVRTLLNNKPQSDESVSVNTLNWDGLDDSGLPVALGIYTVQIDAHDSSTGDVAITRTRTASISTLASINGDLNKMFENNSFVYPNPVRGGSAFFQSLAVRNNATISIRVYTITGDLVREETRGGLGTSDQVNIPWDVTNQSGKKLGRGLYYVVFREKDVDGTLQATKKIAVIP